MTDTPPVVRQDRGVPLGILVVFFYIAAVLAVFMGFAAYITRSEWEGHLATDPEGVQNLDNLIFLTQREEEMATEIVRQEGLIREVDRQIDEANDRIRELESSKNRLETANWQAAAAIMTHFRTARLLAHPDEHQRMDRVIGAEKSDVVAKAAEAATLLTTLQFDDDEGDPRQQEKIAVLRNSVATISAEIAENRTRLDGIETDLRTVQSTRDRHLEARSPPLKRREALAAEAVLVHEKLAKNPIDRARLGVLRSIMGGWLFLGLVSWPTIFLTLLVTIAAGSLGAVVSFSRSFRPGSWGEVSASRLFVGLGEGMAAAIAIFLFSGAGMLVLTQGAGPQKEVELSPYSVAFIAFLSGFMAEDAFTRIQEAGRNLFKSRDAPGNAVSDHAGDEAQGDAGG